MEEKERYINQVFGLKGHYKEYVFDTYLSDKIEFNECYKVLNQQDKRIKELEETNKVLSNELTKNSILKQDYIETCCGIPIFEIPKMKEENQQLKQQLAITEKAFELAVNDKCYAENCIAESFIGKGAKVRVPKKEQWYLEQAKEMLENE